jgi:cell fate (sporulation/competence/biofilm development) regulator YlbF (YheA/YmcA/DUF963 family)
VFGRDNESFRQLADQMKTLRDSGYFRDQAEMLRKSEHLRELARNSEHLKELARNSEHLKRLV